MPYIWQLTNYLSIWQMPLSPYGSDHLPLKKISLEKYT